MKNLPLYSFLIFTLLFVGCASTGRTRQDATTADFGPIPSNPEKLVKDYFYSSLIDPNSLMIQSVGQPYKGYASAPKFIPDGHHYGWGITATINSKNRMGGYVGWKQYVLFVRYERVYRAFETFPPVTMAENLVKPVGF